MGRSYRDMAVAIVDRRHGYTYEHAPSPAQHLAEYDEAEQEVREDARPKVGDIYRSRSGREWQVFRELDAWLRVSVTPLGPGLSGPGGVKARRVDVERLRDETHGWRRVQQSRRPAPTTRAEGEPHGPA